MIDRQGHDPTCRGARSTECYLLESQKDVDHTSFLDMAMSSEEAEVRKLFLSFDLAVIMLVEVLTLGATMTSKWK